MDVNKWDFKKDGYHPSDPGLRKKLTGMGYIKILPKEIQPGAEIASKNATDKDQSFAVLAGRLFLRLGQETQALHQGDIVILMPGVEYRMKASGNVPTKVLLARKDSSTA